MSVSSISVESYRFYRGTNVLWVYCAPSESLKLLLEVLFVRRSVDTEDLQFYRVLLFLKAASSVEVCCLYMGLMSLFNATVSAECLLSLLRALISAEGLQTLLCVSGL